MMIVFNRPRPPVEGEDTRLFTFLLKTFEACAPKSKIWGTMFAWTSRQMTRDIAAVRARRDLELHIYAGNSGSAVPAEVAEFFASPRVLGTARKLDPDGMMNHCKWLMFEDLDWGALRASAPDSVIEANGVPNGRGAALWVATANITDEDTGKHNAAVLVPIRAATEKFFHDYYVDLKEAYERAIAATLPVATSQDRYQTIEDAQAKFYTYPRKSGKDTLVGVIENLQQFHQKTPGAPSEVRIVTPRWRDTRLELAKTLRTLRSNGGRVEVVTRGPDEKGQDGKAELGDDVYAVIRRFDALYLQKKGVNIHSKYMMVSGLYRQSDGTYKREQLVWTGSPNLTGSAIDGHWELLAKLSHSSGAYAAFLSDFNYLRTKAATLSAS